MARRFSVEAQFKAIDRVTAPISRMQNRVGKFTRSAEKNFRKLNKTVKKFGDGIKKAGAVAVAGAAVIGAAIANVTKAGAEFGRAIGSAAAKFPDDIKRGDETFKALEKTARKVGATTEFTATQAAKGLGFLAKAGFDAKFSMDALAPIVDFATASELDLATAADIASDAIGSFGLNTEDPIQRLKNLNRVMDVMSLTANSTNTSVEELFEAVKDGAPIAAAAGVEIETFSATMGFLASNGIKAGKAGTAAKNITLALAGVGNKAAETFARFGIKLQDSEGNLRDQFDVMDDLRKQLKTMGQLEKVNVLSAIFGKIPLAAATKLLESSGKEVRKLRTELEGAGGSSKRTAEFIRGDVKGSLDGLNSAIEGVKISIFSMNEGPLKDTIDGMTKWVRENEKLIASGIGDFVQMLVDNFDEIVLVIKRIAGALIVFTALSLALSAVNTTIALAHGIWAGLTAAVGLAKAGYLAFQFVILGIPKAIMAAQAAMWLLNFAMSANPLGVLVIGFGLLVGLAAAVILAWDPVTQFFSDLAEKIKVVASDIVAPIKKFGSLFGFTETAEAPKEGGTTTDAGGSPFTGQGPLAALAQVAGPGERTGGILDEVIRTNKSEVTIKDETGRAEQTGGDFGPGLMMLNAGAF